MYTQLSGNDCSSLLINNNVTVKNKLLALSMKIEMLYLSAIFLLKVDYKSI